MPRPRPWAVLLLLGVLVGAPGCRQPNPDWLGPAGANANMRETEGDGTAGADATDNTADGADTTDSTADSASADATSSATSPACSTPGVLGSGACPAECAECIDGVCVLACLDGDCRNTMITCPAGWGCEVDCLGGNSCRNSTIACPPESDCNVACAGNNSCRSMTLTCGGAPCGLSCAAGNNVCRGTSVLCGEADTQVQCEQNLPSLELMPGPGSCACEAPGC